MLRDKFILGMSNAASTVNIVTTDGPSGRAGLTVSAMSSVSADPPSLLICVNAQSKSAEVINQNGVFCVNVLNDSQAHISDRFSGRHSIGEKFAGASWNVGVTGAPLLGDALVKFDCKLKKSFQWGSHYIFIGEIVEVDIKKSGNPLVYAHRAYGRTVKISHPPSPISSHKNEVKAKFRVGSYVGVSPFFMPGLIAGYHKDGYPDSIELIEGTRNSLLDGLAAGELDLAVIYQYEPVSDERLQAEHLAEVKPYVLLPSGHHMAKQAEVSLKDLEQQPLISSSTPSLPSLIDDIFEQAGVEPFRAYRAPSFEVLRGMVGHGLGYAITFTDPACKMSYDGAALVRLPIAEPVRSANLLMVHRKKDQLDSEVVDFLAFCRQYFMRLNNA